MAAETGRERERMLFLRDGHVRYVWEDPTSGEMVFSKRPQNQTNGNGLQGKKESQEVHATRRRKPKCVRQQHRRN